MILQNPYSVSTTTIALLLLLLLIFPKPNSLTPFEFHHLNHISKTSTHGMQTSLKLTENSSLKLMKIKSETILNIKLQPHLLRNAKNFYLQIFKLQNLSLFKIAP